jgi:peptidoglycan/LPS O-acetylase OafA/YrhL
MILVMLMLVSALSSFDFAELEDNEVIEDTGARAALMQTWLLSPHQKKPFAP